MSADEEKERVSATDFGGQRQNRGDAEQSEAPTRRFELLSPEGH